MVSGVWRTERNMLAHDLSLHAHGNLVKETEQEQNWQGASEGERISSFKQPKPKNLQ